MVAAAGYARAHEIPCLGLCLGLQVMVIDVARHLAGLAGANSREFDSLTPHPVIDLMHDQADVIDKGGTMRLGAYPAKLAPGSQVAEGLRHRLGHRAPPAPLRGQPRYRARLEAAGLRCSGTSPDGRLVEFIELPGHPFWVGTQAHPEFKSRPDRPHPLFRELVGGRPRPGRGPRAPPHRARRPRRRPLNGPGAVRNGDHRGPVRPAGVSSDRAKRRSSGAGSSQLVRPGSPIPTASSSSATWCATPARSPSCRWMTTASVTLVRQFRPAVWEPVFEIPAGTCDVDGEPPEETARRELAEEAGLEAGATASSWPPSATRPGFSDQLTTIFLATGLTARARPADPGSRSTG